MESTNFVSFDAVERHHLKTLFRKRKHGEETPAAEKKTSILDPTKLNVLVCRKTAEYKRLCKDGSILWRELHGPSSQHNSRVIVLEIGSGLGHTASILHKAFVLGGRNKKKGSNTTGSDNVASTDLENSRVIGFDALSDNINGARLRHPKIRFEQIDFMDADSDTLLQSDFISNLIPGAIAASDGNGMECNEEKPAVIVYVNIIDVDNNRGELGLFLRLLPLFVNLITNRGIGFMVVKSPKMEQVIKEAISKKTIVWDIVKEGAENETLLIKEQDNRSNPRSQDVLFKTRYPLKLPIRYTSEKKEMCRWYNYSKDKCLRLKKANCLLDHTHCHWCGENGHFALECQDYIRNKKKRLEDHKDGDIYWTRDVRNHNPSPHGEKNEIKDVSSSDLNNSNTDKCQQRHRHLYVLGGRHRGRTLSACEKLNLHSTKADNSLNTDLKIEENSAVWEDIAPLAENRGSHAVAAGGNWILVIGGGGLDSNLSSVELLQIGENDQRSDNIILPDISVPRHALEAVSLHRKNITNDSSWRVYAIGGWQYGSEYCSVMEYLELERNGTMRNPTSPSWTRCAPLQIPRRLHSAVNWRDTDIYVFGGFVDHKRKTRSVECYKPLTDNWELRTDMPYANVCVGAAALWKEDSSCQTVQEGIFLFPYGDGNGVVSKYIPEDDRYETLTDTKMPISDWHCFIITSCNKTGLIYLCGGASHGKWLTVCYSFNPDKKEWKRLADMRLGRRRAGAVVI